MSEKESTYIVCNVLPALSRWRKTRLNFPYHFFSLLHSLKSKSIFFWLLDRQDVTDDIMSYK